VIKKPNDAARKKTSTDAMETQYLRLYVTGGSPHSRRAIENTKRLCEEHLQGRYDLEVIDLYQQPELARDEQLVAVPTLVKYYPPPTKRFVGDMTRTVHILRELNVQFEH
jgi:circadian clock protein KaiB